MALRALAFMALAAMLPSPVAAQEESRAYQPGDRAEIWDIPLGTSVEEIRSRDFTKIACGTNGGPPSLPIAGFADFMRCKPEADGLREVYFEYDDEAEFWALAHERADLASRLGGTRVFDFPVILSLLFDEAGVMRGIRAVTDPRAATSRERSNAAAFGRFARASFREEGWQCIDHPQRPGFEPANGVFIDQDCEKQDMAAGRRLLLTTHQFRKPGQYAVDPVTREPIPGNFDISGRLEVYAADYGPADFGKAPE